MQTTDCVTWIQILTDEVDDENAFEYDYVTFMSPKMESIKRV